MIVRPAREADAPRLAEIYGWHVLNGLGTFEEAPPDAAEMGRRLAAVQAQDLPWFVVAEDGRILGYAYAGPFRTRAAYAQGVRAESHPLFPLTMSRSTRATQALDAARVSYTLHAYDYDPDAPAIGLQAAEAIGADPATVLKTLMTQVDDRPVCVVVPSDREVSMKALARAAGGKVAAMMRAADAERLTGFVVGGISPFGQKRKIPTFVDQSALAHPFVFVNAGRRGLQARLAAADLVAALGARTAALAA